MQVSSALQVRPLSLDVCLSTKGDGAGSGSTAVLVALGAEVAVAFRFSSFLQASAFGVWLSPFARIGGPFAAAGVYPKLPGLGWTMPMPIWIPIPMLSIIRGWMEGGYVWLNLCVCSIELIALQIAAALIWA